MFCGAFNFQTQSIFDKYEHLPPGRRNLSYRERLSLIFQTESIRRILVSEEYIGFTYHNAHPEHWSALRNKSGIYEGRKSYGDVIIKYVVFRRGYSADASSCVMVDDLLEACRIHIRTVTYEFEDVCPGSTLKHFKKVLIAKRSHPSVSLYVEAVQASGLFNQNTFSQLEFVPNDRNINTSQVDFSPEWMAPVCYRPSIYSDLSAVQPVNYPHDHILDQYQQALHYGCSTDGLSYADPTLYSNQAYPPLSPQTDFGQLSLDGSFQLIQPAPENSVFTFEGMDEEFFEGSIAPLVNPQDYF